MKFLNTKSTLLVAVLALTSFAATAALMRENAQHKDFERAARMQTLSVIAIQHKDYATACRAQRDAMLSLARAHAHGADIYGQGSANVQEICSKAGV